MQKKTAQYQEVPQIVVIDFDRTLSDVDAGMTRLYNAAEYCGINADKIKEARAAIENDGGSFDPLTYVVKTLDPKTYAKFKDHFISAPGPELLYRDAKPFLAMLEKHAIPYFVLTYGINPEWQHLKIHASGYHGGFAVMDHADKGAHMETWRIATNGLPANIHLPISEKHDTGFHAHTACLIDDKAAAFASLAETYTGFWLKRNGEQLKSQQGTVPSTVKEITSLDELTVIDAFVVKE